MKQKKKKIEKKSKWPTQKNWVFQPPPKAEQLSPKFHRLVLGLKFMFSKKATKFDKIFTIDLTLCSKCQIGGEDFVYFCGILRKHEL